MPSMHSPLLQFTSFVQSFMLIEQAPDICSRKGIAIGAAALCECLKCMKCDTDFEFCDYQKQKNKKTKKTTRLCYNNHDHHFTHAYHTCHALFTASSYNLCHQYASSYIYICIVYVQLMCVGLFRQNLLFLVLKPG